MPKEQDAELLLVYPLENLEVGTEFREWAPHVTLMPWFTTENQTLLRSNLHGLAYRYAPISIEVGQDAMFGPDEDIPVQLVKPNPKLTSFHNQVLEALQSHGRVLQEQFVGENYRPHITEQRGRRFNQGQLLTLGNFVLVSGSPKEPGISRVKKVVSRFPLGRQSSLGNDTTA